MGKVRQVESMSEPSDVERAKERLREAPPWHAEDVRLLLSDHDRLTRELWEAREKLSDAHCLLQDAHAAVDPETWPEVSERLGVVLELCDLPRCTHYSELQAEVADLRAKLAAAEAEMDRRERDTACAYPGAVPGHWKAEAERQTDRADKAEARLAELQRENERHKRWHRKPTHGRCCTCQKCGLDYDTCRCSLDDVADELEKAEAALSAERGRSERLEKAIMGVLIPRNRDAQTPNQRVVADLLALRPAVQEMQLRDQKQCDCGPYDAGCTHRW